MSQSHPGQESMSNADEQMIELDVVVTPEEEPAGTLGDDRLHHLFATLLSAGPVFPL